MIRDTRNSTLTTRKTADKTQYCVFELGGGSNNHMEEIKQAIQVKLPSNEIKWTHALHPILEIENERLQFLFVVSIGCDVFPGIKGVTPRLTECKMKKAEENNTSERSLYDVILEAI